MAPARLSFCLVCLLVGSGALAQQACPPMPITLPESTQLLFSSEQERYLGDIVSEHLQSSTLVIDEEDVNDYLRNVGERLIRQFPADIHYRFFLYGPAAN